MMTATEQIELLSALSEGDVFEVGKLFTFAPKEKLVWKCEEALPLDTGDYRYTFHVYYFGVMLKSVTALVQPDAKTVTWGAA